MSLSGNGNNPAAVVGGSSRAVGWGEVEASWCSGLVGLVLFLDCSHCVEAEHEQGDDATVGHGLGGADGIEHLVDSGLGGLDDGDVLFVVALVEEVLEDDVEIVGGVGELSVGEVGDAGLGVGGVLVEAFDELELCGELGDVAGRGGVLAGGVRRVVHGSILCGTSSPVNGAGLIYGNSSSPASS